MCKKNVWILSQGNTIRSETNKGGIRQLFKQARGQQHQTLTYKKQGSLQKYNDFKWYKVNSMKEENKVK